MKPKIHEIREKIFARLEEFSNESDPNRSETLLIQDDHFYGHRFQLGTLKAVLTNDDMRVKFYNSTGRITNNLAMAELIEQANVKPGRAA